MICYVAYPRRAYPPHAVNALSPWICNDDDHYEIFYTEAELQFAVAVGASHATVPAHRLLNQPAQQLGRAASSTASASTASDHHDQEQAEPAKADYKNEYGPTLDGCCSLGFAIIIISINLSLCKITGFQISLPPST